MSTLQFLHSLQPSRMEDSVYIPRKTADTVASAPCETCDNATKCAQEHLACRHFAVWMDSRVPNKSHSKVPNKEIYRRLFHYRQKK